MEMEMEMEEKQRRAREKSSFAVTCSLLSQFLKENRGYGDLQGIGRLNFQQQEKKKDIYQPPTTMNLFPGSDISAETGENFKPDENWEENATISVDPFPQDTDKASKRAELKEKEINAQLTIFYEGKVMIFDNFPATKAKDLMEMADKEKVFVPNSVNVNSATTGATAAPPLPSEARASVDLSMPIARRASLHRFLEKRKDRVNSNAPYLVKSSSEMESVATEMKQEKKQSWLTLGHNSSFSSD